ncbi:MAG: glycoside hydrolase family 3 N-terminal domain-containing protein [Solirubrobacteraceae bacterium]
MLTLMLAAAGILGVGTLRPHEPGRRSIPTPATRATTRAKTTPSTVARTAGPPVPSSPGKLLGQRIMVGLSGTSPSRALLDAVRAGHVGSIILFASNLVSRGQTLALTGALQRAARAGGNPRLLISVDQEGGQVKRLPAGPPNLAPPQIAATGKPGVARQQGAATAHYLRRWGINMDLAPVADVPTFGGAFIWRQGRAFSFHARRVADFATAFALGLQSGGVAATAKHFPGLGSAATDTDFKRQELSPSAAQRSAALTPYQRMIASGLDAVMLSTAGFPAYDPTGSSAALSAPIAQKLLRGQLGFRGVTITDALGTPTGHDERTAGLLAAQAGADILLYTDSAPGELATLQTALRGGRIAAASAAASYRRILALKHTLGLA